MAPGTLAHSPKKSPSTAIDPVWGDRKDDFTDYKVLSGPDMLARVVRANSFSGAEHSHPEAEISCFMRGSSGVFLTHSATGRASRSTIAPGNIAFITPFQPHRMNWITEGEVINIYLPQEYLQRISETNVLPSALRPLPYRQEKIIENILQCLLEEFSWSGCIQSELVDHARFLIAARTLRMQEAYPSLVAGGLLSLKRLQPAVEFLSQNFEASLTLLHLASLCNSSVFHFARSFNARLGCPPFAYQRTLRLRKAQELLQDLDLTIEDVGSLVGIKSASSFSRSFRRELGISPTAFRQKRLDANFAKCRHR